jgi:hypothetical protein
MTIIAVATMLVAAPALGQTPAPTGPAAAKPAAAAPSGTANPAHVTAKPAVAVSTPESRSAAALALSHEPTYDEGTAQRIKEAALSYSATSSPRPSSASRSAMVWRQPAP